MKVLVACEESQRVCISFREKGHQAFSCDIIAPSGNHPEWHIKGDALKLINGNCSFTTMDGETHTIEGKWDLIIAHPPCTYMCIGSACRMFPKKNQLDEERFAKSQEAKKFFMAFLEADCDRVCVENPTPLKVVGLPPYTQAIEPYQFGDPFKKRTCLWLKGLPKLLPANVIEDYKLYVNGGSKHNNVSRKKCGVKNDAKDRSKTFWGIAKAFADQWGDLDGIE